MFQNQEKTTHERGIETTANEKEIFTSFGIDKKYFNFNGSENDVSSSVETNTRARFVCSTPLVRIYRCSGSETERMF